MTAKRSFPAMAVAGATVAALAVTGTAQAGTGSVPPGPAKFFDRTATYPVFENRPAGEDPATETVAEISAVSGDGRTLVYTDAAARRIGFLDISRAERPRGLGTLSLAGLGDAEDEPTSVAVVGRHVLVVVNTSASYTEPSGRVDVIDLDTRERVRSLDLGGQPDSIAVSANK
ncbi:alkaline phosphatase, partial [Micromonospora fluostatini]